MLQEDDTLSAFVFAAVAGCRRMNGLFRVTVP